MLNWQLLHTFKGIYFVGKAYSHICICTVAVCFLMCWDGLVWGLSKANNWLIVTELCMVLSIYFPYF